MQEAKDRAGSCKSQNYYFDWDASWCRNWCRNIWIPYTTPIPSPETIPRKLEQILNSFKFRRVFPKERGWRDTSPKFEFYSSLELVPLRSLPIFRTTGCRISHVHSISSNFSSFLPPFFHRRLLFTRNERMFSFQIFGTRKIHPKKGAIPTHST